ncbi:MAG: hypothetical protein WC809_15005 [Sinimarinibacterium sp.]
MRLLRALLLAVVGASSAACLGLGVAALLTAAPAWLQPDLLMEQQPMRIRFKQDMSGLTDAVRLERLVARGRVSAVLPLRETLKIPLRGRYRLHADIDQRVPVRMVVRHTVTIPVTTVAEIEAATQLQYAGVKQYRNVRFRARLPLQFDLQVPLEVRIDTLARVSGSMPLTVEMNHDMRVALSTDLRTRLDLDHEFRGARLGGMRVRLHPDPDPVNIVVTRALMHWPAAPAQRGAGDKLDPDQNPRVAKVNNEDKQARAARMKETTMIDANLTSGIPVAPYIYALLGVFAACVTIFFVLALNDADDDTWLVRAYQGWRMSRVRLRLMLQNQRVDPAAYRRVVPVAMLKRQIAACRGCPSKAACDRALACREASSSRLGFCLNLPEIERLQQVLLTGAAPLAQT